MIGGLHGKAAASLIPGMLYERPIAFEAIRQVLLRKIRESYSLPPITGQIRRETLQEIVDMIEYGAKTHGN